jgi:hypothetical protein
MTFRSTIAGAAMLAAHQTAAQEHRFEANPVASVRENFVACDVLSQLILASCWAANAPGDRVRIYANRGPYVCIYPHQTITTCKWTHSKALSK